MLYINKNIIKTLIENDLAKDVGKVIAQDVERIDGDDIQMYDVDAVKLSSILDFHVEDDYEVDEEEKQVFGTMSVDTLVCGVDDGVNTEELPLTMVYSYNISFDDFNHVDGIFLEWVD